MLKKGSDFGLNAAARIELSWNVPNFFVMGRVLSCQGSRSDGNCVSRRSIRVYLSRLSLACNGVADF
jgi:hypothetical protein